MTPGEINCELDVLAEELKSMREEGLASTPLFDQKLQKWADLLCTLVAQS